MSTKGSRESSTKIWVNNENSPDWINIIFLEVCPYWFREVVVCLPNNPFYENSDQPLRRTSSAPHGFLFGFWSFPVAFDGKRGETAMFRCNNPKTQTCCLTSMGEKWKSIQEMVILRIVKSGRFIKRFCPEVDSAHLNDPKKEIRLPFGTRKG